MSFRSLQIWSYMAWRFVKRHKRKTIATGSFIILGTGVLVFLHALTIGINDTMVRNSTHLHYGDAFLEFPTGYTQAEAVVRELSMHEHIQKTLLRYRFSALLINAGSHVPVIFYAVHPAPESDTTAISRRIICGSYPAPQNKDILLGYKIAERLKAGEGDIVSVFESSGLDLGEFRVKGIYRTEIPHFDNTIAYIPIQALHESTRAKHTPELSIFFSTRKLGQRIIQELRPNLPDDLKIQSWDQLMPDLMQLIEMNEIAMRILILFVFILVGFGISNSYILTIVERFREFGILKAMGVTPKELMGLIFLESFMVCFVATMIGLAMGWIFSHLMAYSGIDFSSLTSHNRYFVLSGLVRPRVTLESLCWPGLLAVIISIFSSYLPTRIAAAKTTTETLRFA